jgi:hypothetical protein
MDEKVRRLVDEYQAWWTRNLKRFDDPEQAAPADPEKPRIESLDAGGRTRISGLVEEPGYAVIWDGGPPRNEGCPSWTPLWDLENLKRCLTLFVPTWIKNNAAKLPALPMNGGSYDQWSAGDDLPFPPALVENICEEDIQALQETFGPKNIDRYSYWSGVYREVNERFIESEGDKAREVISEIKTLEDGRLSRCKLTSASLFFLGATAYLMECKKREEIERQRADRSEQKRARAQRQLSKAMERLKKATEEVEQKVKEAIPPHLGRLYSERILAGIKEAISGLEMEVQKESGKYESLLREISCLMLKASGVPKTRSENDMAVGVGEAYKGIKNWVEKAHRTDYRASEKTKSLLEKWGLSINKKTYEKRQRRQDTQKT